MSTDAANKRRRVGEDTEADAVAGGGGQDFVSMEAFAEMKAEMARMKEQMNEMQKRKSTDEQEKGDGQRNWFVGAFEGMKIMARAEIDTMKEQLSHVNRRLEDKCERQERKIQSLEARCDLLMRAGVMLMKNEEWEYAAPDIDVDNWIERGFEEEAYHERMGRFVDGIKRETFTLRKGTLGWKEKRWQAKLSLGVALNDDQDALVYDDALLPHWIELAEALQIAQIAEPQFSEYYSTISIKGVELTPAVMNVLTPALRNVARCLELESNDFTVASEGVRFATDCIENNRQMERFHWCDNTIESNEQVEELADALIEHPNIVEVTLKNCFGENSIRAYAMLRRLVACDETSLYFTSFNLSSNAIRTAGDTAMPDFLSRNPELKRLVLTNNSLNDDDAFLIARALKHNTNLRTLELGENDITCEGRNALRNAIYDPTSLNHVSDCNHTCRITGLELPGVLENRSIAGNRGSKIFALLSSRNREGTNVQHLDAEFEDDSSSKLVPHVLECVHRHSRQGYTEEKPLSILYEILRGWKMPSLYDNAQPENIE